MASSSNQLASTTPPSTASQAMPYCAMRRRIVATASRVSPYMARAPSEPWSASNCALSRLKPPNTKPPLRPEAPWPTVSPSRITTSRTPRSIRPIAVARPAKPPPITHTCASMRPRNAVRAGAGPAVAA